MPFYLFFFQAIFGILPSLIWLFYYLRKDLHPEPKKTIIKVFIAGAIITIPVFLIQTILFFLALKLKSWPFFVNYPIALELIKWFLVVAFIEELLKYIVVRLSVLNSYVIDEPLDPMIYMIVAALGFAAVENMLYLFSPLDNAWPTIVLKTTLVISFIRFIGATFLHTLCSALLGYFLSLSFFYVHQKFTLTIIGIILAALLHGFYNFSIITLSWPLNLIIPALIIFSLALFILHRFDKNKTMKSISVS